MIDPWPFWMAVKVAAYMQEQERRGRKPACAITRQVAGHGDASGARVGQNPVAPLPKPRGPDPEEEERKVVEGLLQAGDLDGAIEACGPMAVRVWLEAMSRRNPARTRIRATEAVMARVRPVKGVEERRATVHIHFSPAERQAIEVVCKEVGVELPALAEPGGK